MNSRTPLEGKPQQELIKVKGKIVYVFIPKEYMDDPFLDILQVAEILNVSRAKAHHIMRYEMKHYKDKGNLRVRKSWLQEWIDDHTEGPSRLN
jgi:hypothetical protein